MGHGARSTAAQDSTCRMRCGDVLSKVTEPLLVNLLFRDQMAKNLGRYSDDLIQVFQEAEKANSNLVFRVVS